MYIHYAHAHAHTHTNTHTHTHTVHLPMILCSFYVSWCLQLLFENCYGGVSAPWVILCATYTRYKHTCTYITHMHMHTHTHAHTHTHTHTLCTYQWFCAPFLMLAGVFSSFLKPVMVKLVLHEWFCVLRIQSTNIHVHYAHAHAHTHAHTHTHTHALCTYQWFCAPCLS